MDKVKLEIRLNGVLGAFQREPGCPCPRCTDPDKTQRANTSASVILRRGDKLLEHHLVDVGLGVVESITEFGGPWPIHSIILTHAHFDHVAGIDWLTNSLCRARDSGVITNQPQPIPVFCATGTWKFGLLDHFPYLVPKKLEHRLITLGTEFSPGEFTGLTLTPLPVVHFKDSVIYILQFWSNPEQKVGHPPDYKAILCWDLLRFTQNGDTKATSEHDHQPGLDESHALLFNANLLLIESNTWNPHPETRHISYSEVRPLIEAWKPEATRIIHYSGWEDRPTQNDPIYTTNTDPGQGPVSSANLQTAIQKAGDKSVKVGYVGESFISE
jgi:ribonuclease BN (tRNA processing enzyme)